MSNDNVDGTLSRRKVLGGMATIGVAGAAAGAGTMALFSDTEQSIGNTIQAGTLDLELGTSDSLDIGVTDAKPGDSGSATANVENVGSLEGGLSVEVNVTNYSQNITPESESTYDQSNGLEDELRIEIGFDDGSKEPVLSEASIGTNALEGERDALKRLSGSGTSTLYVDWWVDSDATNEIQGDEITFEVVVRLFQESPIVVAPNSGDYNSIQAAVDAASAGQTIEIQGGTYNESVTVSTADLQLLGAGSGSVNVDAGGADPGVEIAASGVTLSGMKVSNAGQAVDVNGEKTTGGRASGVTLSDISLGSNVGDRGVVVDYTDEAVVRNVSANNCGNDGVTLWYTHDSRVEDVTANDNGDNGVYFNGDHNVLLDATAENNADEGIDINWYDDLSSTEQRVVLDGVVAKNNNGGEDIELHDNGTDDTAADDSKLLKNVETGGATTGLLLAQVADSEVELVESTFPNGTDDGNGTDVDP